MRIVLGAALAIAIASQASAADPLPSWNEGAVKASIVRFVERVTDESSVDYVPPAERVATFDNDGCLWSEKPIYFQLRFALDRVAELAADHPEWRDDPVLGPASRGEMGPVVEAGEAGVAKLVMASHAGMTTDKFAAAAREWLETARHPRFDRPYRELVYQPMLELLAYLRANGFKTFIVSGGGIDFLRVFAEETYGVPPEQVVGSSVKTVLENRDGQPVLTRLPEFDFIDDKAGKPVGIHRHIGRRPIAAFGNSDGDLQMLQWTTAGEGPRFGVLVRHTDAEREWRYDRQSAVGKLDVALDEASERGWTVVDMQRDWRVIYPPAE